MRLRARGRVREGNGIATLTPARPAHNPYTGTSDKPLRDPSLPSLNPHYPGCLDTEGCHGRAEVRYRHFGCVGFLTVCSLSGREDHDESAQVLRWNVYLPVGSLVMS